MSTSDSNTQAARVLIVDDHPNTAEMLARVIRKLETPVEVLTAASGEDALQQLGDSVADILITDFMMPGMSGLELIEKLQEGRKPAHTILMTAYDTPGLSITIRRLDIQDYLVKPVDPERVRDIVSKAITEIIPYRMADVSIAQSQRPFKILIADDHPDNVRLLCDLFHMNIEETDIAGALVCGGKWVGHIHFVDSNRRPVGLGHMQYGRIIEALRAIDYQGHLCAEAFPYPDPHEAARQTMRAFQYWTGC